MSRWIGVHTGGPHYLDHLGILCEGLNIPLIVTEDKCFFAAKQFYPNLHVIKMELSELNLDYLAESADVIFESGHTFATELIPLWEMIHGKKMRVVYCPHGNSDKISPKLKKDISLVYGDHMYEHLRKTGELSLLTTSVITGNWRAYYYKLNHSSERLQLDPDKKTVLFAPTWEKKDWFQTTQKVIREMEAFNLVVRLHPFLEDLFPAEYEIIRGSCRLFSDHPMIYPLMQQTDYYLGDFSSIGYDFLWCNRPLFFVDRFNGDIFECGTLLRKNEHYGNTIATFSDTLELAEKRKKLYVKVFGQEKSFDEIKNEIKKALSFDRASWI